MEGEGGVVSVLLVPPVHVVGNPLLDQVKRVVGLLMEVPAHVLHDPGRDVGHVVRGGVGT